MLSNITYIAAEPEQEWIEDIVVGRLLKIPVEVFQFTKPWDSVITQHPFIYPFNVREAKNIIQSIRNRRVVLPNVIFPKDEILDSDASLKEYIERSPIRIMLTGDEVPDFREIGELLVAEFRSNLITPTNLIKDQIRRRTRLGSWLLWNLDNKRCIPIWVVMRLLESELKRERYAQRGFILIGFPIIPCTSPDCEVPCQLIEDMDYTLDGDVGEHGNVEELNAECDTEATESISYCSSTSTSCSNFSCQNEVYYFIRNKKFVLPDGGEDNIRSESARKQLEFIYDLWCRPDYIVYLNTVVYTYQFATIMEVLQKFILFYFREHVLQIDFQIGIQNIMHSIRNRFKYINYKINYECTTVNSYDNKNMSLEELCDADKISPNFKWSVSAFGMMCPVSLYQGRRRICDNTFLVHFLRFVFLFYSTKEREMFIANPCRYLNLVPACRVAIIGPHRSGKTTLSKYFAHYFNADIYTDHIKKAEHKVTAASFTDFEDSSLSEEFHNFEKSRQHEHALYKHTKIEEWTHCVLHLLDDICSKVIDEHCDMFSGEKAEEVFETYYINEFSEEGIKQLFIDHAIFNSCTQNICIADFLDWVYAKPKSHHLYRQYVIDSAPLNMHFWDDLLENNQLPDCVFFIKTSSSKKMADLYSFLHNETCINNRLIHETICQLFTDWKEFFEPKLKAQVVREMDVSFKRCFSQFFASRFKELTKFIERYKKLQLFFHKHGIECIEVDISNQSWTQSISNALVDYTWLYHVKPITLNRSNNANNPQSDKASSSSYINEDKGSDNDISITVNYGTSLDWCPVILNNHNALLKGHPSFTAEYKNKIYVMHSSNALQSFISNPQYFARKKWTVPPARVYIIGVNHLNKLRFAQTLATSLNVGVASYMKNLTSIRHNAIYREDFCIQKIKETYEEIKTEFLENLRAEYKKGAVIFGYPMTLEQFDDAIAENLYPECIVMIQDKEEILDAMLQSFARLGSTDSLGLRNLHESVVRKYQLIVNSFLEEELKIEEACKKLLIAVIKLPKLHKREGLIDYYVEQINQFRSRIAFFENVQVITMKESELLLNRGYYRFSRFKYSCPVDVYHLITLNHFEGMRQQECIFPCIFRHFIYFINGKKNLKSFKRNPVKYVNTCNPPQMPDPMRIAVFGASKSGVSSICREISQELGSKIFSMDDFKDLPITTMQVIDLLKKQNSVTPNGIVLDNIPLTPGLLLQAAKNSVDITAVFIIVSSFAKVLENWHNQGKTIKNYPRQELQEIQLGFWQFMKSVKNIRKSTQVELFNIHYLDGDANNWTMWEKVKHTLIKTTRCITGYRIKLMKNRCANLGNLNLFYDALVFKRDINHHYCHACLDIGKLNAFKYFYVNVGQEFYSHACQHLLNQPYGYLNDAVYEQFNFQKPFEYNSLMEPIVTQTKFSMCMVQFRDVIYWCCDMHTINFMLNVIYYYNENQKLKPLYIPFLVIGYTKKFVAYDGYCPVEFERGVLEKGNMNLSVYYPRRVPVPDDRFDFLCEYHKPVSKVPAFLNVVDIAGLVKGAAEGQGLGNAFLSHISACDAIFHLCRAFEDPDVTHIEGEVDPVRDLDIICEELRLKDEEKLLQNLDKLEKVVARGGDKKLKPEYDSMLKVKTILIDEKKHLRFADWNAHDIETLNKYMFLTTKPMIYLVNLSDKDFIRKKNKWLAKIKEWVDKHDAGATIIPFSGHFEHDLAEKDESECKAYEEETKCKSVLDKIIITGYKALQLEYFFTAGPDEVKAWTIQKGTKAPQAAGRIHTDFEKGFIMAEVMHFKDFKEEGSEAAAKSAGKYRQQGRNYVVEDGDIIFFKFNAGAGLKDAKKK